MSFNRRIIVSISLLVLVFAGGTAGYMLLEDYTFLDALYMTVITVGTVGYGEVQPLHTAGRIFTIVLLLVGLGVVAIAASQVVEHILRTLLHRNRRMERKIHRMSGHVIICGYGRIGREVATLLRRRGCAAVVIEDNEQLIEELEREDILCVRGDATADETLLRAHVHGAATLVTALPSNADNVYVTLSARNLNPDIRIIARATGDPTSRQRLLQAGASRVISPYEIGSMYIATSVLRPHVLSFMDVVHRTTGRREGDLEIDELTVTENCRYANRLLRDTAIRSELNIIVLAIRGPDAEFEYNPSPDTVLSPGSTLICIGFADRIDLLARDLGVEGHVRERL